MLICQVADSSTEGSKSGDYQNDSENNANEYQTADDIFRIMTSDEFNNRGDYPHGDLVVLYKNIDLNAQDVESHITRHKSNQRVETIIHNDDPDTDSEISEVNSAEDLHNVFMANKERIDFFNNTLDNRLCPKHSNTEIQSVTNERHFAFHDPYIKQQLRNFTLECETPENTILPATLLDYICCKRLEDNYNFYMDNIIRYVQHTIEQLKRISNGDYLTDKAKQKWKYVDDTDEDVNKNMKVLATSTSIPLRVERKPSGSVSTWDDIVQSEVDIRSLSKILEKRIVIEIPKIISGTYKIFSKNCSSNLLITCKKQSQSQDEMVESRLDVVLKLERSETGQVMSNISSIMVLQTPKVTDKLTLTYNKQSIAENFEDSCCKIIELDETSHNGCENKSLREYRYDNDFVSDDLSNTTRFETDTIESSDTISIYGSLTQSISDVSYNKPSTSAECLQNYLIPDDLMVKMRKFDIQTLPEEIGEEFPSDVFSKSVTKKKSPTKVRIKSPYENKSYYLEEKKRKRLLEIRERRERRKMALGEVCKVNKQKYGKSAVMPQPSNSVTKLSITNKSFYNSIYGHAMFLENNHKKGKILKLSPNNSISNIRLDEEHDLPNSDRSEKKFINRSFYLDETETEMMYVDSRTKDEDGKENNSIQNNVEPGDFTTYNVLKGDSSSSIPDATEITNRLLTSNINEKLLSHNYRSEKDTRIATNEGNVVPMNSPNNARDHVAVKKKKSSPTLECRKSIDELYDLIPKLDKKKDPKKNIGNLTQNSLSESSTFQESDSGTSLKHQFTSSNPSSFSFPKNEIDKEENKPDKKSEAITPRVVISSKPQLPKQDNENQKKKKKVTLNPVSRVTENPLKAISQLLHEIENIQIINKDKSESKVKKQESANVKNSIRQTSLKGRSQIDQHLKEPTLQNISEKSAKTSITFTTSRRPRPLTEISKNHPQSPVIEKVKIDDKVKRKLVDIIDEAKEARGEAVRGPPKTSRLNTLAQPKKSYVQAHNEEYYSKYGRNLVADKLQRLTLTSVSNKERTLSANSRNKSREGVLSTSTKTPSVPPSDRNSRVRRSASCSPENLALRQNIPSQNYYASQSTKVIKKMGEVESYVNTHFRNDNKKVTAKSISVEHRSRVPLVPKDIDLDSLSSMNSVEESSKLGSKLHFIIDSMLGNPPPVLSVLSEGLETSFMSKSDIISYNENKAMVDEKMSIGSDYPIGVLEDINIVTAVENMEKKDISEAFHAIQAIDSVTEVDLLEKELYKQISNGTFKKNLRLNKLTLTPKRSLKQALLLQSGDDGSLGVKSLLPQSLQMKSIEKTEALEVKSVLSKLKIDWDCLRFPMKVMTIGYNFPVLRSDKLSKSIMNISNCSQHRLETMQNEDGCLKTDIGFSDLSNTDECGHSPVTKEVQDTLIAENENISISGYSGDIANKLPCTLTLNDNTYNRVEINDDENKKIAIPTPLETKTENVVNTSSLDILVGLLNEIQKISECQTNMTKDHGKHESKKSENRQQLEHKTSCNEKLALTRFINPRGVKSQPSIYTFYLNAFEEEQENIDYCFMPGSTPKLGKNLPGCRTISRFTDPPSLFSLSMDHGTAITESLLDMLSESSSQSFVPLKSTKTIQTQITRIQDIKNKSIKSGNCSLRDKFKLSSRSNEDFTLTTNLSYNQKRNSGDKKQGGELLTENAMMEYDPLIKMKKEILVTVYSILVFTVFAALSLPEVFSEY